MKRNETASYVLAYTLKDGREVDYFEVFCEENEAGDSPFTQAKNRRDELINQYDDEDSPTELYSWNICRIVETSEHYAIG